MSISIKSGVIIPPVQVEISVCCRNLTNRDATSKSDPMCVLFMKTIRDLAYVEKERTEVIQDTLNPEFAKKFLLDYYFEEIQKIKFELYDVDCNESKLNKQDYLGFMECTLGELVGSTGSRLERDLLSGKHSGSKIIVRSEEVAASKELVTLQFEGRKLDKKDVFGKSDPFLVFSKLNSDKSFSVVHRSEVVKNTLNPLWVEFSIKGRALCNGDHERIIRIDCYDWDDDGSHDLIGSCETNLRALSQYGRIRHEFELVHPEKLSKKKGYTNSGKLILINCKIEPEYSFLEFLAGGMQLGFTVAVDFTGSNGDPHQTDSLHYMSSNYPNQYQMALNAVGQVIQDYDSDKMFPALGFGAKLPGGIVSHEFALNGNLSNPFCAGIEGVMYAYQQTLKNVQLYGPTNFAPVINHVAKMAAAYREGSHYFILLIITDGAISDMDHTKEAIILASSLPMSIIIVGVGNAEFDSMEELDADKQRISLHGRTAQRDIVQFVPFRNFLTEQSRDAAMIQALLAKEVLKEIPDQITQYMKSRGIAPKPAPQPVALPTSQPILQSLDVVAQTATTKSSSASTNNADVANLIDLMNKST